MTSHMRTAKSISYIRDQQTYLPTSLYAISQPTVYVINQPTYLPTKQICDQPANHKLVFDQPTQQLYTPISSILISEIGDEITVHVGIDRWSSGKVSGQTLLTIYVWVRIPALTKNNNYILHIYKAGGARPSAIKLLRHRDAARIHHPPMKARIPSNFLSLRESSYGECAPSKFLFLVNAQNLWRIFLS